MMENDSPIELIHDVDCSVLQRNEPYGVKSFKIILTKSGADIVLLNHQIGDRVAFLIKFKDSVATGYAFVGDPVMQGTGPLTFHAL